MIRHAHPIVVAALVGACSGEAGVGNEPSSPPAAPANVTVEREDHHLLVRWDDLAASEARFVVARGEVAAEGETADASSLVELTTVVADQRLYRDLSAEGDSFYVYGVASENAAGRSEFVMTRDGGIAPRSSASAAGPCVVALPSSSDRDGDGLADEEELEGWSVSIDETGRGGITRRVVQSSPERADTDDDGVCDLEERRLRIDPTRADTDADGLDDEAELRRWASSPTNVDTDGDADGNTVFFDGSELERYGTSPTLDDTDGDGVSDFVEVNQNASNPRLANLPQARLTAVGDLNVALDVTLATGGSQQSAVTQAFVQSEETAISETSAVATTVSTERSVEASASVGASFPSGFSMSVEATTTEREGYVEEASTTWSESTSRSAQEAFEEATDRVVRRSQTIEGGTLEVQIQVDNVGPRAFELNDVVITALRRDPRNRASFSGIATLSLPEAAASITLAPGESAGPFLAEAAISASSALELLEQPSGVFFRAASFQLVDRTGENFQFVVGEATNNRTALITLDYGGERPLERYRVATNVERRDGARLAGVRLVDALRSVVGLEDNELETAPNEAGVEILTRLRDVAATEKDGGTARFWAVIAAENSAAFQPVGARLLGPELDFSELRLLPRDRVYLAYVSDEDGDGLFSREERLNGTSDQQADSDGDGLSDFDEIRTSWGVFSNLPYYQDRPLVASSPIQADADGDGWNDALERDAGTDPNRADTDADGAIDSEDDDPLLGLSAPAIHLAGTVGSELVDALVVDSAGNRYVWGASEGDFDDDGDHAIRELFAWPRFLASYDPEGETRWAIELEDIEDDESQPFLRIDDADRVSFVERLYADAIPGASGRSVYLSVFEPDGGVAEARVLRSGNFSDQVADLEVHEYTPLPGGRYVLGATGGAGFSARERLVFVDASGTVTAAPIQIFQGTRPEAAFARPTGEVVVPAGCRLQWFTESGGFFDEGNQDLCGVTREQFIVRVHRDSNGDQTLLLESGEQLRLNDADALVWRRPPPAGVDVGLDLKIDALGRPVFAGQSTNDQEWVVWSVDETGEEVYAFSLPQADIESLSVFPGRDGDLHVAGHSKNGFGGRRRPRGQDDIILLRNPQVLFGR
jgi:hypothetical protein